MISTVPRLVSPSPPLCWVVSYTTPIIQMGKQRLSRRMQALCYLLPSSLSSSLHQLCAWKANL